MGIKQWIAKQGIKAGNRISKLSTLSPSQMEHIIDLRDQYFGEMASHDPGYNSARLTRGLLAASSVEIMNAYLPQLYELYTPIDKKTSLRVVEEKDKNLTEQFPEFDKEHNIRYINISKWVTDKRENSLEKLVNVYAVLSNEQCNIALIFHRTKTNTQVYLAVVNTKNAKDNSDADEYIKRLADAVRGNFPGSVFSAKAMQGTPECLSKTDKKSVAIASNIPTEKSEKFISQTIEKLLDGIIPESIKEEYTLILLATPIRDAETRKLRLSELYTGLAPYSEWQTNFTYTETMAEGSSATIGINVGASAGIQNGQNQQIQNGTAQQESKGKTDTEGVSQNNSTTETDSEQTTTGENISDGENTQTSHTDTKGEVYSTTDTTTTSKTDSIGGSVSARLGNPIAGADISADRHHSTGSSLANAVQNGVNSSLSDTVTNGTTHTITEIAAQTVGKTVGKTIGSSTSTSLAKTLGRAVTNSLSKTAGVFQSFNLGGNIGASFARSSNVTATIGKGEGITQSFTNHTVKHALELLEQQMARFEQSTALGMWDFAAYVISEDVNTANNAAHSYLALTEGESSFLSHSAVNVWRGDIEENGAAKMICGYLQELRHPEFAIDPYILDADPGFFAYPPYVTATTALSGKELAYSLNFPSKSISGLPIYECAEFGRNIAAYDMIDKDAAKIKLGHIFHMNHEEKLPVDLSADSLASHTFITGSTGSGKSSTVYQILSEAYRNNIPFLVIEPAKGEYKDVFSDHDNVSVYGTNPSKTPLLRIDPFSFPVDVHVLEHIDRLAEIFNVCWPMYAAMPAVLKSAVERSYIDCGWDMISSTNKYGELFYPSFNDVARNIKIIIDNSEYDTDNKGAYKGSLLTRLRSLTTGINGLIFSSDELTGEELFDKNVIIDLSRVGSTETKSLIMGMLVLKLQEYRISENSAMNSTLRHITALEEAHNILRRTSIEQPTESSNIMGKSVEMIANAIAEMRTYGEGFVIADQAPGLMDMSVIRNTNTKIIMRLPDRGDRELVGKAANLNDDQIDELAKLPCGVGAVYQNEWIQSVLCKVTKYETAGSRYSFEPSDNAALMQKNNDISDSLLKCIMDNELFQKGDKQDLKKLKSLILHSALDSLVKADFLDYLETEREKGFAELRCLIYDFLRAEDAIQSAAKHDNIHEWVDAVITELKPSISNFSKKQIDLTMALILHEKTIRDPSYRNIYHTFTEVYKNGGGVF